MVISWSRRWLENAFFFCYILSYYEILLCKTLMVINCGLSRRGKGVREERYQVNRHNILITWHAANEYGGWVKVVIWFRLSHKSMLVGLTLTLPGPSAGVSGSLDSYCSLKPLCSGMGEVVPARTSPTLLPPFPRTVLSLSCFKVSQCINCRDWHCKS